MDAVKKSSLTLTELVITMTLAGILILVLTVQFVAMVRFGDALRNKAEPSREAYIVMAHMTNVLRFAKPSATPTISFTNGRLEATIEKGHISLIPETEADTVCYYRRDTGTGYLYFSKSPNPEVLLSQYVTYFDAIWDALNYELTLKLIFTMEGFSIPVETKVKVLILPEVP